MAAKKAAKKAPAERAENGGIHYAIHRAFQELEALVDEIPDEVLLERTKKDLGLSEADFHALTAIKALEGLGQLSRLGDRRAVRVMVKLALDVVDLLNELAFAQTEEVYKAVEGWGNEEAPYDHPERVAGVISKLTKFSSDNLSEVESALEQRMGWLDVSAAVIADPTASVDGSCNLSVDDIHAERATEGSRLKVESIFQHLVARRFRGQGRAAVREVAAESFRWPVDLLHILSSGKEKIRPFFEALGLGSKLPYRITSFGGRKLTFREGTETTFAFTALRELESQRRIATGYSDQYRAEMAEALCRGCEPDYVPRVQPSGRNEGNGTMDPWLLKASLLPPFSGETLGQWLDAAMSWARCQCRGRWKGYPWPTCVLERAGYENAKKQSRDTKTVVKEKLLEGLKTLLRQRQE